MQRLHTALTSRVPRLERALIGRLFKTRTVALPLCGSQVQRVRITRAGARVDDTLATASGATRAAFNASLRSLLEAGLGQGTPGERSNQPRQSSWRVISGRQLRRALTTELPEPTEVYPTMSP